LTATNDTTTPESFDRGLKITPDEMSGPAGIDFDFGWNVPPELTGIVTMPEYLAPEPEPTAPYVQPISLIHRGQDGYVSFHRKQGEKFQDLCSVRAGELQTMFPQFAEELERDAYFSVNSFYRTGYGQSRVLPNLKNTYRENDGARYLNACYVDIDCHDGPVDYGALFGKIINAQDRKLIPPASLIARSGRGLWLFWLLIDSSDFSAPQRAWPDKVIAHSAIEQELIRRLGGDPAASDVARITRVPGSVNSKVGDTLRVMFWTQRGANGKPYFYTIGTLAGFLGVELPQLRQRRGVAASPERSERGVRGHQALWTHRFHDFQRLRDLRGGFRRGCRNSAAYFYGLILRGLNFDEKTVRTEMDTFGQSCWPPLTDEEILAACEQTLANRWGFKDSTVAAKLKVTAEEGSLIPRWAPKQAAAVVPTDMNMKPAKRAEMRRRIMLEIIESRGGYVPSCREMSFLLGQRGFEISYVAVFKDYSRLNLSSGSSMNLLPFTEGNDKEKPLSSSIPTCVNQ
jgi:hypothetical protein